MAARSSRIEHLVKSNLSPSRCPMYVFSLQLPLFIQGRFNFFEIKGHSIRPPRACLRNDTPTRNQGADRRPSLPPPRPADDSRCAESYDPPHSVVFPYQPDDFVTVL